MAHLALSLLLLWGCVIVSLCHGDKQSHHVELTIKNNNDKFYCGGSLISDKTILTIGQCWREGWTVNAVVDGNTFEIKDKPIFYKDNKENILILTLPEATQTDPIHLHDCGPQPKQDDVGKATVHGGSHDETHKHGEHGSKADITVVDCKDVSHHEGHKHLHRHDEEKHHDHHDHDKYWFCAKSTVKICKDDSGGGVVYKNKLYGVIPSIVSDCAASVELIKLCEYKEWIKKHL